MPPCHKRQHSTTRHHTRSTSRHCHWDRHRHNRSKSVTFSLHQNLSHDNSCRSHSRSHHRCHHRSTSWHHHSSTYCYCHDTPQWRSSLHRRLSTQLSRSRSCTLYKPSKNTSSTPSSSSSRTTLKPQDKKQRRVMIDNSQSDHYSSDDTSSDSEDDLN